MRWSRSKAIDLKLYSNPASPFARKALIIARELSLKLEVINTSARNNMEFRRINPLGKIPALALEDGSVLFDSPVICEYLNHRGGGKFFPGNNIWRQNSGRWKALVLQALGDGIMEAALGLVYEERFREPEHRSAEILAYQAGSIATALDALERVSFAKDPTIGEISVGCALGYLDFRRPELDWRAGRTKLAGWYERFSEYPSVKATVPTA
jgi:glutathione S-transferase